MGFYLRKSISVGPLRFNLSKSGIGVSAGIRGLRFGAGPRGNYVHMGRGGLYYRATIPSGSTSPKLQPRPAQLSGATIPPGTHAPLEEIESADVAKIVDSSSRELLDELNRKQQITRLWPIVAVASAMVLAFELWLEWPNWLLSLGLVAGGVATYIAHNRDVLAKTVVLFYEFEPELESAYGQLHTSAAELAGCAAAWHIEATGKVYDRKYHAGASDLVRRKRTFIRKAEPPYVKTNIETIAIVAGRQTLHFFPDRILVYDQDRVGAVSYQELRVNVGTRQFIEDGSVPRDAKVVRKTWKYVNKSGGPDRRFKHNPELPVCDYEEISLSSQTGLNELLQISRCGFGNGFAEAIASLGKDLPKEDSYAIAAA
jgi:hypothetical protein